MPQSPDLRAQLENAVIRDLLGPANGPEEIVDERAVRERYLLGKLGPQGQSPLSGFDEILTVDDVEGELDLAGVAVLMRYTLRLLTGYALSINMELGVLIQGGPLPGRVADQFAALIRAGVLQPVAGA